MLKLSFGNVPASEVNSQKVAFILGCIMFLIVMVAPGCFAFDTLTISASGATGSPDSALTIQPGNTVKFYSVSTAVDGKYSFQWQLNGSDIAGATGREYAISSNAILKTGAISIACTTPVVTIKADYCSVAGKVLLKATSTQNGAFLWSTGETTSNIFVDIVGNFSVKVTTPQGCVGTGSIQVGKELVVNGNFDAGNTGFTSPQLGANQYQYRADVAGNSELVPEGLYGIGTNAQNYHSNFWGYDHTTGSGNYMIINGFPNGSPQPIAWQEKVKVRPNIVYYFSAWEKA